MSGICATISKVYYLFYISYSRLTLPTQHHIFQKHFISNLFEGQLFLLFDAC